MAELTLEEYLKAHENAFPDSQIGANVRFVESYYEATLVRAWSASHLHRNVNLKKGKSELGKFSFIWTEPELFMLKIFQGAMRQGYYINLTLNACRFISKEYGREVTAALSTYEKREEAYLIGESRWKVDAQNAVLIEKRPKFRLVNKTKQLA